MSRIHYTKPSITHLEVSLASDAAANGWGADCYRYIDRFEKEFSAYLGVKHAIATSSCTGAMHLGLAALGIRAGDEVILGDTNWIASVAPVVHLGAIPIFVDVLPDSWCLDPEKVLAAITPRTKAIIAVHLYGNLADVAKLQEIANQHGIFLIEDAAEALGSAWGDCRAGAVGAFGTFSFHGTKTLTTGEGGMFVTQDSDLYDKVLTLSNHGRQKDQQRQFWAEQVGYKYKMSNIQAAIGCAQLERVDDLVDQKRRVFETYYATLKNFPLAMNPEPAGTKNGYWMPTIVVNKDINFNRDNLLSDFKRSDIDGRVFFWPLSMLPMFDDHLENTVSYGLFPRAVNLPSYHDLSSDEIGRVCEIVARHVR